MGRRGPQPKNPDRVQRKNVRTLAAVDGGAMATPDIPNKRWLKVTKDGWVAFWDSDLAGGMRPKDVAALTRLFNARNLHERMARMVDKNPLIAGAAGQAVLNPAANLMTKLQGEIRQLEREFGLTPDAGVRMMGAAASAQRSVDQLVADGDDDMQVIDVG